MSRHAASSRREPAPPKYAIPEVERRWLVDAAGVGDLSERPSMSIEDLYVAGSRLRLRRMESSLGEVIYKLCKKYGKTTAWSEPITNLYLDEAEFRLLERLPGARIRKRRYRLHGGSLDVFEAPHAGLMVFEREFGSEAEAEAYEPPLFAVREIGQDSGYSGAELARAAERDDGGLG